MVVELMIVSWHPELRLNINNLLTIDVMTNGLSSQFQRFRARSLLNHWGRVTHICVSKLNIIRSANGLSPGWSLAIIWTNAGILLVGPLGTNFSETFIEIETFSFKKMIWMCRLRNVVNFVSALIAIISVSYYYWDIFQWQSPRAI